jgi:hypothetical protein
LKRFSALVIPTNFKISSACAIAFFLSMFLWTIKGSAICRPIFMVGSREVIGSWKIIAISFPRIFCISLSDFFKRSCPWNMIEPPTTSALLANKPIILLVVTDLPEPDSPTMANVSPLFK